MAVTTFKGNKSGVPITAVGIVANRFHSACWTQDGQMYTWGLNAGQLGHLRGDTTVPVPKLVSSLNPHLKIKSVSGSEGAIVILSDKDEIIALHEYQTRRVVKPASKIFSGNVVQMEVIGGHLDPKVNPDLIEKGGCDLKIIVLTDIGKIFIWDEFRQTFNLPRFLI